MVDCKGARNALMNNWSEYASSMDYYGLHDGDGEEKDAKHSMAAVPPEEPGEGMHPPAKVTANSAVPRMALKDLTFKKRHEFCALLKKHSFIVVSDIGQDEEENYAQLMKEMAHFFCQTPVASKAQYTSKQVYRNEKNTPMWYCGFEQSSVREAFRIHAGNPERQAWPSESIHRRWSKTLRFLQRLCDQSLSLALGYKTKAFDKREDRDFSVCYCFYYPNTEGSGQSETENVFEHVDPSIFIAEPVPDVHGLEVFDQHTQEWIQAEEVCIPGKEIILFCGKALQQYTNGGIDGTLHRVTRAKKQRLSFIYEQKYEEYYND